MKPPSPQERAEADFREALSELQNGDAINAEVLLKRALGADPLADKARQALLGIYMQAGRRDAAESLLEERLDLDRSRAGFALALARLQLERSGNSEALTTLQRSAAFGEGSADFQAMYGNTLSRLNRHREAAERYAAAARLAPRNPLWQMALAMELRSDNRPADARAAYLRAQELGGLNSQLTSFVEQQLRELH